MRGKAIPLMIDVAKEIDEGLRNAQETGQPLKKNSSTSRLQTLPLANEFLAHGHAARYKDENWRRVSIDGRRLKEVEACKGTKPWEIRKTLKTELSK